MVWLLEKAKEVLNLVDKNLKKIENEFNDESMAHQHASALLVDFKQIYEQNKKNLPPEVNSAAQGMIAELSNALAKDSKIQANHWPQVQYNLVVDCLDIISKYESTLEAAPGFWNQIAAKINKFVQAVTGEKEFELFPVQKTVFGANETFKQHKEQLQTIKSDFENKAKEVEDSHENRMKKH